MATMNMGLLGDLFGGGTSALSEYLTPQQQESMQRQALLSTAAALLQAGGPSPVPISLGQALGAGLQAGTSSYGKAQEGAIQQLLTRQKLDEYKRQMDLQERVAKILGGGAAAPSAGAPITPEQAIGMPGLPAGPTVQRAEMIGQVAPAAPAIPANVIKANQYRQIADVMVANNRGEDAKRYLDMAENLAPSFEETVGEPFRAADNNFYIRTKRGGVIPMQQPLAAKPVGAPQQVMGADRKPTLVQMYDDGTFKPITGVSPLIPPEKIDTGGGIRFENPYEIKPGTVFPKTISPQVVGGAETGYYIVGGGGGAGRGAGLAAPMPAPAGAPGAVAAPTVPGAAPRAPMAPAAGAAAPTGPQPIIPGTGKGFANEKDLRTEFTTQMKPYVELAQAFRKVEAAALNPSAAGDISLVYGYMKILDPGSTVMQGEQATAQNAGGVPDRIRATYNKALTGESLADNVRVDFYSQARNLIESQRQMAADVGDRYRQYADAYKLDSNQIVFDPFKRIKTPAEIAADAAKAPAKAPAPAPASSGSWFNRFNLIPRPN